MFILYACFCMAAEIRWKACVTLKNTQKIRGLRKKEQKSCAMFNPFLGLAPELTNQNRLTEYITIYNQCS